MKRHCVVSFCTADLLYKLGLTRLRLLVGARRNIDFLGYCTVEQLPKEIPRNLDSAYAYKPWLFEHARQLGYQQAFWMDTSIVVHRLSRLFELVEDQGFYSHRMKRQIDNNVTVGQRCTDEGLAALNLNRAEAQEIPQMASGVVGLNFENNLAMEFMEQWKKYSLDGVSFKGYHGPSDPHKTKIIRSLAHGAHREQSVASVILHRLGIMPVPLDTSLLTVDRSPKGRSVKRVILNTAKLVLFRRPT